jgi:hypothetical protein
MSGRRRTIGPEPRKGPVPAPFFVELVVSSSSSCAIYRTNMFSCM